MEKIDQQTPDLTEENIERLAELFPDVVTESRDADGNPVRSIDFEALKGDLADHVVEGMRERYQFTWPGKAAAKLEARRPTTKTMRPVPGKSVDWDTTKNLYIEGDNLDALKIMRETYAGKVKLIYIDPPYNTGNDSFVYPDNFGMGATEYSDLDGELDEIGNRLVENRTTYGRFHSVWCSMLYERLVLLRDLLAVDGLIAISINDVELFNLGKMMDDVFGASNRLACAPWRSEPSGGKDKTALRTGHEYILFYSKTPDATLVKQTITDGETDLADDLGPYRKGRELRKWGATSSRADRPSMWFGIVAPNGKVAYPYKNDGSEGYWRWSRDNAGMREILANPNRAHWELCPYDSGISVNGEVERWVPFEKTRSTSHEFGWNTWLDGYGTNADGTSDLKSLFNGIKPFDTPKPIKLLEWIVGLYPSEDDEIILDIFSGAAGTAEASMRLSMEDQSPRRFIMVQIPETYRDDSVAASFELRTICDIGEERIRRAGRKIVREVEESNQQLAFDEEPKKVPDIGFRVMRIDDSCLKDERRAPGEVDQASLDDLIDNSTKGSDSLDLLFQVLPAFRIPYSASIQERDIVGTSVYDVNEGELLACFDENVSTDAIEAIAREKPVYAVFRDASLADDSAAANLEELFKTFSPDTVRRVI